MEYVANARNLLEAARKLHEEVMFTQRGVLLPTDLNPEDISSVLDVGCGPGGWVLSLARAYPHLHVTGADVSLEMIEQSQQLQRAENLSNVDFVHLDSFPPLPFADASFDLVHGRFLHNWLRRDQWPLLLSEAARLLCTGGRVLLTEWETGSASHPAVTQLNALYNRIMYAAERGFAEHTLGFAPHLKKFLREIGFVDVQMRAVALDMSADIADFSGWRETLVLLVHSTHAFNLKIDQAAAEAAMRLLEQAQKEMEDPTFASIGYLCTVWGHKETQAMH
jgi:ubiquinone/menaquinone biosynthesis C-methylase UbiE